MRAVLREGRRTPSIPPGRYFRMVMSGYFEGIASERGLSWRVDDSLSLKSFLGLGPVESAPDRSSLSIVRRRLPVEVFPRLCRAQRKDGTELKAQRTAERGLSQDDHVSFRCDAGSG